MYLYFAPHPIKPLTPYLNVFNIFVFRTSSNQIFHAILTKPNPDKHKETYEFYYDNVTLLYKSFFTYFKSYISVRLNIESLPWSPKFRSTITERQKQSKVRRSAPELQRYLKLLFYTLL